MTDKVGRAEYTLAADDDELRRDLAEAARAMKKAGAAMESAFGKQATESVKKVEKQTQSLTSRLKGMASGGGIGGAILGGVGLGAGLSVFNLVSGGIQSVIGFLGEAGEAASDLSETQAKLTQVFSSQSAVITEWAEDAATSMGLSQQAALEATGTLGNFLQAMGTAEPQAAEMSMGMVQLAADIASFNNVAGGAQEVLVALQAGLAGETEPLRRYGVDISDAAVQAELLAQGVQKVGGAFTQGQKIQGRYALTMRQTATAQGDFARTADGTANKTRTLNGLIDDGKAKLGTFVNEVTNAATGLAIDMVGAIDDVMGALEDLQRFLDPAGAAVDDINDVIRAQAELYGYDAEAVVKYADEQRQAAAEAASAAQDQALLNAQLETFRQQLTGTGLSVEDIDAQVAAYEASLTTATAAIDDATDATSKWQAEAARVTQEFGRLTLAQKLTYAATRTTTEIEEEAADQAAEFAEAQRKATEAAKLLAEAMGLVADTVHKEFIKAAREAERGWDRLAKGPDANRKSLNQLEDAIEKWSRRYAQAIIDGREDLMAYARTQRDAAIDEVKARRLVQEEMARQQAALVDLQTLISNIPARKVTRLMVQGGQSAIDTLATIKSMLATVASMSRVRVDLSALSPIFRQHGGPASGWTMVGEAGRELVNLPPGSYVHPHAQSERMVSTSTTNAPSTTFNLSVVGQPIRVETPSDIVRTLARGARMGYLAAPRGGRTW